ncbi:Globin,Globin-like [Cinara cedri]|uniref:Globin,Globin-like n=1 Tax=Cinara cedri TaxID=506608 RepID=A0A5E4NFP5_9HEMI|nr:Globin,Globin-like [Cinara cedri]
MEYTRIKVTLLSTSLNVKTSFIHILFVEMSIFLVNIVMAFVQKAVARLYEPDKLETLLRDLGKKHYHYGAKQKYVDLIGPQFIIAIQPSLVDRWTEEIHLAWTSLFLNMAYIMKGSMAAEERFKVKKNTT